MCGYWIGFIVYLLLIIGGIYALKLSKLLGIRYLIFSLFIDAFYISIPYQNITCQFIFGGLTLLTIFVNLSVNFVQSDKNKLIKRFELVFDFVLGVGLSIYLIYIIPNPDLKNIIIPIVSAVYGGLLTLVGVAWTIRKSDNDRKQEQEQKAKPVVFICDPRTMADQREKPILRNLLSKNHRGSLQESPKKNCACKLPEIIINNSDYSHASVIGFRINNDCHLYDIGQVLPKNSTLKLDSDFRFIYKDEINYVAILIQDMLDNIYEFEVRVDIEEGIDKTIKILSGIEMKKTTLPLNAKEI